MGQGGAAGVRAAANAGEVLLDHVGWLLSCYIAVLLGFYVVVIGGQILGGNDAAARVRRMLGAVAELMAAVAIVLVAFVGLFCVGSPKSWGVFVAVGPTALLLVFLAVQLGRFLIPGYDFRLGEARRIRNGARSALGELSVHSRRSWIWVWLANAGVVALPSAIGSSLAGPVFDGGVNVAVSNFAVLAVVYFLSAMVFFGWNGFSIFTAATDRSRSSQLIFALIGVGLYTFVAILCLPLIRDGMGWFAWPLLSIAALSIALSAISPGRPRSVRANWSCRSAVNRLIGQRLLRTHANAVRDMADLTASTPDVTPSPSTFRRLLDVLRTRPSASD